MFDDLFSLKQDLRLRPLPGKRTILHLDMDAFFASVGQLDHPHLRGRPVIVSGHSTQRGVVACASYEARAWGVKASMPLGQALHLCPEAVVLAVNMPRYRVLAKQLFQLCSRFSPRVEALGFEEAYLDLTGCEALLGSPMHLAKSLQAAVQNEIGLRCSLGGGGSKLVAGIASALNKPGGLSFISDADVVGWLGPMDVGVLPGVGPRTRQRLQEGGVLQVQDLLALPFSLLEECLGPLARDLVAMAQGHDPRPVMPTSLAKSMGATHAFDEDLQDEGAILRALRQLSGELGFRLRQEGLGARRLGLTHQSAGFEKMTIEQSVSRARFDDDALFAWARALWLRKSANGRRIRRLSLWASQFVAVRESSWLDAHNALTDPSLQLAKDALRLRYGKAVLTYATQLTSKGS